MSPDHFKPLFDHLRQAEQSLADQEVTLERLRRERQAAHDAVWTAIDAELDATTAERALKDQVADLQQSVQQLQTLVLELSARVPPPPPTP